MNRMRLRIAERLKQSQNAAASLTTFNEIDMSALIEMRKKYKGPVLDEHGVKLRRRRLTEDLVRDADATLLLTPHAAYDLREIAPGPVLTSTSELIAALRDLPAVQAEYAERYADFAALFCSEETGKATPRVVDAFFSGLPEKTGELPGERGA